jgi:hypothetical protein
MYAEIQITAIATCWREMPFRKVDVTRRVTSTLADRV